MAALSPVTPHADSSSFTLDERLLAARRADSARRVHTVQMPAMRLLGFTLVCLLVLLVDLRGGEPFPEPRLLALVAANLVYAGLAWFVVRHGYGRTGRLDLSFAFLHFDVLMWLLNLYELERGAPLFAFLLLMRVADQVGFGFRRALYFSWMLPLLYLAYAGVAGLLDPGRMPWLDRVGLAAVLLLLGAYIALTGLVIERVRNRMGQAMRAARELVASLEHKTHALEVQAHELERARRQAEQASLAKSQFLATISHEIRTPMNGILGTTELLMGAQLDARQQRYARTAHRSATVMLALIDDLMDLSRIETGQFSIEESVFDVHAVLHQAVEMMSDLARSKPVALACAVAPGLPARLEGDPRRLRQVLVNLLNNAIKFTDHGRVDLTVQVLQQSARAVRLRFEVRDTGVGIADDKIDSVFDAFVQADGSSTRKHGGSGIGLALVKQLAEAMGGRVGVESEVGEGSLFWFELPLLKAPGEAPASAHAPAASAAPAGARRAAPRVLMVEDDAVNQLVLQEMLATLGCRVDIAADGGQALAASERRRYDLVLMDLHMPGMDGFEATRRMRAREREQGQPRTPIVALTADVLEADRDRCLAAGMDDCMTKPASLARLGGAVERWVTARGEA